MQLYTCWMFEMGNCVEVLDFHGEETFRVEKKSNTAFLKISKSLWALGENGKRDFSLWINIFLLPSVKKKKNLLQRFSQTCELLSSKAAFTIVFFAAVNHNYDHKQRTLKHRNTQNGSKSTNHKSQIWLFEPVKVKFCFLGGPLRWLTAAKNALVS